MHDYVPSRHKLLFIFIGLMIGAIIYFAINSVPSETIDDIVYFFPLLSFIILPLIFISLPVIASYLYVTNKNTKIATILIKLEKIIFLAGVTFLFLFASYFFEPGGKQY